MNFSDFTLDKELLAGLKAAQYHTPTPIQEQVIPAILAKRDVVGLAQTGTGKTAAYALPILQSLLHISRGPVQVLVLVPTRELADQVQMKLWNWLRETFLGNVWSYTGVSISIHRSNSFGKVWILSSRARDVCWTTSNVKPLILML